MQRDIGGGEWIIYFSENSFRFNAVYLHQDKERTVAMPLNFRLGPGGDSESMCLFLTSQIRFKNLS
jgi:hypothetical protein